MAIQHVDITDPEIHEPKGASNASAGTVYVSDGSGSGTWATLDTSSIDMAGVLAEIQEDLEDGTLETPGQFVVTGTIPDVSTASSILIGIPMDCFVVSAMTVLGGPITVADATVSFKNSAGADMGTPVTVSYTSSAKGDIDIFTATGNNVLTGPTFIEVQTDGGSTDAQPLYVSVVLEYVSNQDL